MSSPKPLVGNQGLTPQFLVPLGSQSLSILDPTIFSSKNSELDFSNNLFEDSPFFSGYRTATPKYNATKQVSPVVTLSSTGQLQQKVESTTEVTQLVDLGATSSEPFVQLNNDVAIPFKQFDLTVPASSKSSSIPETITSQVNSSTILEKELSSLAASTFAAPIVNSSVGNQTSIIQTQTSDATTATSVSDVVSEFDQITHSTPVSLSNQQETLQHTPAVNSLVANDTDSHLGSIVLLNTNLNSNPTAKSSSIQENSVSDSENIIQRAAITDTPVTSAQSIISPETIANTTATPESVVNQSLTADTPAKNSQSQTLLQLPQVLQNITVLDSLAANQSLRQPNASNTVPPPINSPKSDRSQSVTTVSASNVSSWSDIRNSAKRQTTLVQRKLDTQNCSSVNTVIQAGANQPEAIRLSNQQGVGTTEESSEVSQSIETLAQAIYEKVRYRLRIQQERHGRGYTGRLSW